MTAAPPARSSARRVVPWLLVLAGFVLVAVLAGAPRSSESRLFDPSSTAPGGTRALVELLASFGAEVDTTSTLPPDGSDVALLLSDTLDEVSVDGLESWIRGGGTLVVADPFSALTPSIESQTATFGVAAPIDRGRCDVDVLADLVRIEPGSAVTFELAPGDRSCFGGESDAYVVQAGLGDGTVVSLGGPELFVNERLGDADNAAFATRLLVPERGVRVALLQPGDGEGSTDRSLSDVMSTGARLALVQLVVAFVVYAWFRARRLGAPIEEAQPVEIAGSELVVAVGQLLQQSKDPDRAARLLRSDLRRRLGERLGLPADTPGDVMAEVIVARTGLDADVVARAVTDVPVTDDDELLELARTVESVRQEVLHDR